MAATGRAVFDTLTGLIKGMRTPSAQPDSAEAAQIVWGAIHGAVTIETGGYRADPRLRGHLRESAQSFRRQPVGLPVAGQLRVAGGEVDGELACH
ncbi:hypothetical protein H7J08_11625 [Mycobacterium frederiksbergense]|nr:hypothetical protein [Mycolicibacterium frederiksbergense]